MLPAASVHCDAGAPNVSLDVGAGNLSDAGVHLDAYVHLEIPVGLSVFGSGRVPLDAPARHNQSESDT